MSKVKNINIDALHNIELNDSRKNKESKALKVDMELSASGKVINGRIYPPSGHRNGVKTWTTPYPKPAIVNHQDDNVNACIGRIQDVRWVDCEQEALAFLSGNYTALGEIKKAYQANDAKTIYKAMKKWNAFDKRWPGLGKLMGTVQITDQDAIQKIVDKRYLTVSSGQETDAYICMKCGKDWYTGDMCDHSSGSRDEDGDPIVFLCGNMSGREISFINTPANDTSMVVSIQFEDSAKSNISITDKNTDTDTVVLTLNDEQENIVDIKDIINLKPAMIIDILSSAEKLQEFKDALSGDSAFEVSWLIKVHDALHSQYDWQLKYSESEDFTLPSGVFSLHGMLHDLSETKAFRDALTNGYLDHFGADGSKTDPYLLKMPETNDSINEDALVSKIVDKLKKEVFDGKEKDEVKKEVLVSTPVEDSSIDWNIIYLAIDTLVPSDKKVEEKNLSYSLDSDNVCILSNSDYTSVAKTVFDRAKLSTEQKAKIFDRINAIESSFAPVVQEVDKSYKEDYAEAMSLLEKANKNLFDVLATLYKALDKDADTSNMKLDTLSNWFDNRTQEKIEISVSKATVVEDKEQESKKELVPVVVDSSGLKDHTASQKELTNFVKGHLAKYKDIKTKDGDVVAKRYLNQIAHYFPKDFDIDKFV